MQDVPNTLNTIVVGKPKSRKKLFLVLFSLLIVFCTLLAVAAVIVSQQLDESESQPTPVPTRVVVIPTATPTIAPTVVISPTEDLSRRQKYILADCEIEIVLDQKWISSPRGELATCGMFSTHGSSQFTTLTNYPGTLIAVIPYASESVFTPTVNRNQKTNYNEYLKSLPKESNRFDPNRDFLYSQKDSTVARFSAVEAEIYKAGLGRTNQIFYQGFQRQYVIVWGGQTSEALDSEVQEILGSIKQLVVIPTED